MHYKPPNTRLILLYRFYNLCVTFKSVYKYLVVKLIVTLVLSFVVFYIVINIIILFFIFLHNQKLPNTVGFIFGIVQMSLYVFYKNAKKMILEEPKLQQLSEHIIDVVKLGTIGCPELNPVAALKNVDGNDHANGDISEKEKAEEPTKRKDDQSAVNP